MPLKPDAALRKDRTMPSGKTVMQHRHFAAIADIIRRMDVTETVRVVVANEFARELKDTNPNFDRSRFLAACRAED